MGSSKTKGPQFLRYIAPIVLTLRDLGGSGTAGEVADRVVERLKVSEEEQEETTSNGQSRVRNQIGWAKFYLAKRGYIDASRRGVWALTESGREAKLDPDAVYALFRAVQEQFATSGLRKKTAPPAEEDTSESQAPEAEGENYRAELLGLLRSLPPAGF